MTNDIFTYNRAYYIRFSVLGNERYVKNYVLPNIAKVLNEDVYQAIAIEEDADGNDVMVVFLDDIKLLPFIEFCNQEEIVEQHFDITSELLLGDSIDATVNIMMNSDEFGSKFHRFFKKNLTVDIVLDKLSIHGTESLTELDKLILANG